MSVGTFLDPFNKAIYAITVSVAPGDDYLGFTAPGPGKKLYRMEVNYQCDYF